MNHKPAPLSACNGTYLQGHIDITYGELTAHFGEPHSNGDGYKTDAEWRLAFEDGTVATIHNYRDGRNYRGADGLDTEDITDWHVGGDSPRALAHVRAALGLPATPSTNGA